MTDETAHGAAERVITRCRQIAAYTDVEGETTRLFLSKAAGEVQALVRGWMEAAGMRVRVDPAGNLRGVYTATHAEAPCLLIGSHLDTVPNAGAFDGILGAVLGIAVVEELRGERLPFAIEVIGFSEEEGARFARPFLGSMALTGKMDAEVLELRDGAGVSIRAALQSFGLDPERIRDAAADANALGFLEVHIEQGPVLESENLAVGIVDAIAGQTRLLLTFTGRSNHAGTTPMLLRQDAVAAAAEWIVTVETLARRIDGLVATVGKLEVPRGAANVIAGKLAATVDVRHATDAVRMDAVINLVEAARAAGECRGVTVAVETTMEQGTVPLSPSMCAMLESASARRGHKTKRMTSGAGHDAMVLAERMPVAMLFVRSPGGISHHPDEQVLAEDVAAAIETVTELLTMLREKGIGEMVKHA